MEFQVESGEGKRAHELIATLRDKLPSQPADSLTVSQMATLNCVSVKTLHIYQEKGILEPHIVNPETGYRYYSLDQCSVLDAVTQLQSVGFSLDEIKSLIDKGDAGSLRNALQHRIDDINREMENLQLNHSLAKHLLSVCDLSIDKPLLNQIMLERQPTRHALIFDIPPVPPNDENNMNWELAIRSVKRTLHDRGCPVSLFRGLSGLIKKEHLFDGSLVTYNALLFLDKSFDGKFGPEITISAGQYLVMYLNGALNEDGTSPEYPSITRMMEYAEHKGFMIAGDYIGETIATTPALGFHGRDAYFKMNLPVMRSNDCTDNA